MLTNTAARNNLETLQTAIEITNNFRKKKAWPQLLLKYTELESQDKGIILGGISFLNLGIFIHNETAKYIKTAERVCVICLCTFMSDASFEKFAWDYSGDLVRKWNQWR